MRAVAPTSGHYRVVIIGGGPAGIGTALSVLSQGVESVLVAESRDYDRPKIGESLPPDVQLPLRALGVSQSLLTDCHLRSPANASSWGGRDLGYSDFVCHPLGDGWHIDRGEFERDLALTAERRGAEICLDCRFLVQRRASGPGAFHLELATSEGRRLVTADFLVDASGVSGRVARQLGAKRALHDQLLSLCGFFTLPSSSRLSHETLLEAREYGWWYRARLPGNRLIASVACDSAYVREAGLRDWRRWLNLLAETTHVSRMLAGAAFDPGSFTMIPAPSCVRQPAGGQGWLPVGDAASSYDPLFARGIHKALENAVHAGEAIARYLVGDSEGIDEYRKRVRDAFRQYLEQRALLYTHEQRWPSAPFWTRRHSAGTAFGSVGPIEGPAADASGPYQLVTG